MPTVDFAIVGSGILGLSIAKTVKKRFPEATVAVLEKESLLGVHASGRNSGVLHSGIYYKEGSLKSLVCARGARLMGEYCHERKLPIDPVGKVILPRQSDDARQLDLLEKRGKAAGINVKLITQADLKEIEPEASSVTGTALHLPDVAVVEPKRILTSLKEDLTAQGVQFHFQCPVEKIENSHKELFTPKEKFAYGHLLNAAGLYADKVAKAFGIAERYSILPFKGIYGRLSPDSNIRIRGLIYPVPNLKLPFLGVHFTRMVNGEIYVGPTALPALGRENYSFLSGISLNEMPPILWRLTRQYLKNKNNFRSFAHAELKHLSRRGMAQEAEMLVPKVTEASLLKSSKVGIRAQLFDKIKQELVMDFLIEKASNSTHVLNAVSPGFTSAFSFAELVVDQTGL